MLHILESYPLGDRQAEDARLWARDRQNDFLVKSMYEVLVVPPGISFSHKLIWSNFILSKVSFLLWKLWWNRAPTIDNLIHRGMIIPNRCCMCTSDGESVNHLFIHCKLVHTIWMYFLGKFGVQ